MGADIREDRRHVFGHDEVASMQVSKRLRHPAHGQRTAGAHAKRDLRMVSRFFDQRCHIIQNRVSHIDLPNLLHKAKELLLVHDRIRAIKGVVNMAVAEDVDAALVVGIAHADANEEAVELGIGEHRRAR